MGKSKQEISEVFEHDGDRTTIYATPRRGRWFASYGYSRFPLCGSYATPDAALEMCRTRILMNIEKAPTLEKAGITERLPNPAKEWEREAARRRATSGGSSTTPQARPPAAQP